jgi:hypothetical protein
VTFVSKYELSDGEYITVLINNVEEGRITETSDTEECYNKEGITLQLETGTHLIIMNHSHSKISMMTRLHINKHDECVVISL